MNLKHLPEDFLDDISLKFKKPSNKATSKRSQTNNYKNSNIQDNRIPSKFSKNQRKKINSGNKSQIKKLKKRFPDLFSCNNCQFSDSNLNAKWCFLKKIPIANAHYEASQCDLIKIQ